jgi:hypothetical protein
MTRILADLPEEDIKWLDARAAEQGKSRASVLREAVSAYKGLPASSGKEWLEIGFGAWKEPDGHRRFGGMAAPRTRILDPLLGR